jgi:class 3 adenylate cyclase/ABC-type transport system substrate-binding protein/tetratricopeptide (TPR) repeat protein
MPEVREERRIVTALFADVVGSTALAERLGPEEVRLVIGEAISRSIGIVESYGGAINNLGGDSLLALFGAPVAHENDPERAVRAALEIITAANEYADDVRRGWGVENFAMRAGVHTGEVVVGQVGAGSRIEYGVVGDTVNTAARLQSAAEPGTALISETTHRQVDPLFDWAASRTFQLKGKAGPVIAYPVVGLREGVASRQPTSPLIGREQELTQARQVIRELAAGRGSILFILGEPGIGKSRLASELRQISGTESGCEWLDGRCVSYGQSLPYWPYRDLLRNWLDVTAADPEVKLRITLRRKTEALFPGHVLEVYPYLATIVGLNLEADAAARLALLSPESLQYRTFEVFSELLAEIAKSHPVVVAIDDLHWADPTSLALTERLFDLIEDAPVLLTIGQRPETDHPSWQLKEKAAREYRHRYQELSLQRLGMQSEEELLTTLIGKDVVPQEFADRLLGYAEGNPFYLEQMVRSLIDRGTLARENGHWRLAPSASLEIPETLEGVILARIDRLQPEWRNMITSASVLGRTFGVQLLQAVTGDDLSTVRKTVHHLLRLDLLREESAGQQPVYSFKHALIQDTAYRTLLAGQRSSLHHRAAEWFESFYQDRPERAYGLIAHHWRAAGNSEKAIQYLRLAGDKARDEWSLDEAINHYQALAPLLEQTGRQEEASELLFQLGMTLHLAMRYREANDAWREALRQWRPPAPGPAATSTLTLAVSQLPWDPDPHALGFGANQRLISQLYNRLLTPHPGAYVVPEFAEHWEVSADGLRYRVRLAPDLTWSDGRPVNARDVVSGIRRALDPGQAGHAGGLLFVLVNAEAYARGQLADADRLGAEALDDRVVEFRLHRPAPYFAYLMGTTVLGPLRPDLGDGPFVLTKLTADEVIIERNPGYQRPISGNVRRFVLRQLRGEEALAALARDEVDVVSASSNDPALRAASDPNLTVIMGAPIQSLMVAFGSGLSFQTDVALRRAFARATERRLLEPFLLLGQTLATGGVVPPGLPGHTPDVALRFEPDLARRYLAESDHHGPVSVALVSELRPLYADALLQAWRDVLRLEIRVVEVPASRLTTFTELGHLVLYPWMAHYPDAEYFLRVLFHSASPSNLFGWSHPPFDDLIDRALAERTGAGRLGLFHEADRMAVQDQCVVIPLVYGRPVALLKPWVQGWSGWGSLSMPFNDLSIDEGSPRHRTWDGGPGGAD